MRDLAHPKLKHSVCTVENLKEKPQVKRYVVETVQDLNKFLKVFTNLKGITSAVNNLKDHLKRGDVLLLTDNSMAGFPTYCTEHPEALTRVKE